MRGSLVRIRPGEPIVPPENQLKNAREGVLTWLSSGILLRRRRDCGSEYFCRSPLGGIPGLFPGYVSALLLFSPFCWGAYPARPRSTRCPAQAGSQAPCSNKGAAVSYYPPPLFRPAMSLDRHSPDEFRS